MPKALITYFSLTGRTKRAAEALAAELTNYSTTIEPIVYTGVKYMRDHGKLMQGDYSLLVIKPDILNVNSYDLICIGMPVHGGRPSFALDAYLNKVEGIEGKKIMIFATCRFILHQTPVIMRKMVEEKGGIIVGEVWLKNFFKLNLNPIREYAQKTNSL